MPSADVGFAEIGYRLPITRQLIHRGYLAQDIEAYSVLKLTTAAAAVLKGEERIELARPRVREKAGKKQSITAAVGLDEIAAQLFERLRKLRSRLAAERGVPPYVIFGDTTLIEMSRKRPENREQLRGITGVGEVKLERHGADFLEAIAEVGQDDELEKGSEPVFIDAASNNLTDEEGL